MSASATQGGHNKQIIIMFCIVCIAYNVGHRIGLVSFKAKFHYAIWFEAARRPASNLLRTSFEPDSVMEFGREPASSC